MKLCKGCGKERPLSEFAAHSKTRDGLQYRCRTCTQAYRAAWYEKNKTRHVANVVRNNRARAERNRAYLLEYLLAHPCVDCGTGDIRVLDFDHRPEHTKYKNISVMAAQGCMLETLEAEVAKCDVRCKNCHAIKTYERAGGNWRTLWFADNNTAPL
jgi:hypothetical protein